MITLPLSIDATEEDLSDLLRRALERRSYRDAREGLCAAGYAPEVCDLAFAQLALDGAIEAVITPPRRPRKEDVCRDWVLSFLASGPRPQKDLMVEAQKPRHEGGQAFTRSTIFNVLSDLEREKKIERIPSQSSGREKYVGLAGTDWDDWIIEGTLLTPDEFDPYAEA